MDTIPKILHLYWDRSPMSLLQTLTVYTFHKYNPDWVINVYIPKQPYIGSASFIPNYSGKDYFHLVEQADYINIVEVDLNDYGIDPALHNILRSDILRYHLLYNHGGVWSDFDVIWLKPMTHFHNIEYYGNTPINDVNAVVSFVRGVYGGHSIGIMVHAKHDPYAKALVELTKKVKPPYSHEVFGGSMINSKYPTLESLSCFKNIIGVRFETYYPYNIHPPGPTIQNLYKVNDLSCINNNVICLHWYNGHVLSKHYINGDGFYRNCSMTTILKNEGYIEGGPVEEKPVETPVIEFSNSTWLHKIWRKINGG